MELVFLRKLMYSYEHAWHTKAKNWMFSENDQVVIYVQNFLHCLQGLPDSYQLTWHDLFCLVRTLYMRSAVEEIQIMQQRLLMELAEVKPCIDMLMYFKLFNENNYLKAQTIKNKKSVIMIVRQLMKNKIVIDQAIFDTIRSLSIEEDPLSAQTIDGLVLLIKHGSLTEKTIALLSSKTSPWLIDTLSALDKLELLSEHHLVKMSQNKHVHLINALLLLLDSRAIDNDILEILYTASSYTIFWINDMMPTLLKFNILNKNILNILANSNEELLFNMKFLLIDIMAPINQEIKLNENMFHLLHTLLMKKISPMAIISLLKKMKEKTAYEQLVYFFATYDLFNENRLNIINHLHENKRDFLISFFNGILGIYLKNADKIIDLMLSFRSHFTEPDFNENFSFAINYLLQNAIFNLHNLHDLFSVKKDQLKRLCFLIIHLAEHRLLTQTSFELICQTNARLPPIEETKAKIISKHDTGLSRSQLVVENEQPIYIEHKKNKKYAGGYFGKVKKGYDGSDHPVYAIKKPKKLDGFFLSRFSSLNQCRREVKYNNLLGRKPFYFFHKNIPRAVIGWQKGRGLDKFSQREISKQPVIIRLKWLISLLSELNVLHQHYRCHNDIKRDNVVVDIPGESLKLIDFGVASRPKGPVEQKDFCFDMRDVRDIMLAIFPDVCFTHSQGIVEREKPVFEQALCLLFYALRPHCHDFSSCLSSDALQYCQYVFAHHVELTHEDIQQAASKTICRQQITMDDALHFQVPSSHCVV